MDVASVFYGASLIHRGRIFDSLQIRTSNVNSIPIEHAAEVSVDIEAIRTTLYTYIPKKNDSGYNFWHLSCSWIGNKPWYILKRSTWSFGPMYAGNNPETIIAKIHKYYENRSEFRNPPEVKRHTVLAI